MSGDGLPAASSTPAAPARPVARRLHLEITNRCPSHCATCARTYAPPESADLSLADIARILDQAPEVRSVALQVNGEPLVAPHLLEILALLARRGVTSEFNTGGLLLEGALADALLASALGSLNVSLDGATAPTYRAHRGADAFDQVVGNVARFLEARRARGGGGPRVSLWMVVTRRNLGELPALVRLAARLGADEVYAQRLVLHGKGLGTERQSMHGRLGAPERAILDEAERVAREAGVALVAAGRGSVADMLTASDDPRPYARCQRPFESAVVLADGELVPCCISTFLPGVDPRMGNALRDGWDAVFHGPRYQAFRAQLLERDDGPCRSCGVRWSL